MTNQQILSIAEELDLKDELLEHIVGSINNSTTDTMTDWFDALTDIDTDQQKVVALMIEEDLDYDEADRKITNSDWLVYDDEEADDAFEAYLDMYIQDIVYPDLPEFSRYYFDEEKWKSDARMESDRGSSLAGYDGNENYQTVFGTTYYLYRCN